MSDDLDGVLVDFDVSWLLACDSGSGTEPLPAKLPRCPSVPIALFSDETESDLESGCDDLEVRACEAHLVSPASSTTKALAYESSLKIFRRHIKAIVLPDGSVKVDSAGIVSRACYEDWLSTRSRAIRAPQKKFRRIITCSVSGTDGRRPFSPLEEASVLKQLRMKRVWPAFVGSSIVIGSKGFRACVSIHSMARVRTLTHAYRQGYHEKAQLRARDGPVATPSPRKRAKRIAADDVKQARGDAAASICFDWREASREPTADDLAAALHDFEARHRSGAALAFSIFCVDAAPAQNAVRQTALTDARLTAAFRHASACSERWRRYRRCSKSCPKNIICACSSRLRAAFGRAARPRSTLCAGSHPAWVL